MDFTKNYNFIISLSALLFVGKIDIDDKSHKKVRVTFK